jgi:hypothetical protein
VLRTRAGPTSSRCLVPTFAREAGCSLNPDVQPHVAHQDPPSLPSSGSCCRKGPEAGPEAAAGSAAGVGWCTVGPGGVLPAAEQLPGLYACNNSYVDGLWGCGGRFRNLQHAGQNVGFLFYVVWGLLYLSNQRLSCSSRRNKIRCHIYVWCRRQKYAPAVNCSVPTWPRVRRELAVEHHCEIHAVPSKSDACCHHRLMAYAAPEPGTTGRLKGLVMHHDMYAREQTHRRRSNYNRISGEEQLTSCRSEAGIHRWIHRYRLPRPW